MARNRHKKSLTKTQSPTSQPTESKPSAAAVQLASRIAATGADYMKDNFIRIMIDSAKLADEPEFADVSMDREKAAKISENWLRKYNQRLVEAEKKGKAAFRQVSDDMRIHIIDELATPGFRKQVKTRLKALNDRLMKTEDVKKLELTLVLQPMLGQKEIPWGICGLITTIYQRTMDPIVQEKIEEQEIMDGLDKLFKGPGNEKPDIKALMRSPEKLEEATQKMQQENKGLYELLEKKAWGMIWKFEKELRDGKIELDLFNDEELTLLITRLQEIIDKTDSKVRDPESFWDTCQQTLTDILTPERLKKVQVDLKAYEQRWKWKYPQWATTIQLELEALKEQGLEQEKEENSFLLSALFGQLRRVSSKQSAGQKAKK